MTDEKELAKLRVMVFPEQDSRETVWTMLSWTSHSASLELSDLVCKMRGETVI